MDDATAPAALRDGAAKTGDPIPDYPYIRAQRELQAQKRFFFDLMRVDDPFFRMHDGKAGTETTIDQKSYINFASYDYLGFNGRPEVADAAKAAIDTYGISASASRLASGERPVHRDLEKEIAGLYGVDDSIVMVSGYGTNCWAIPQLAGPKDIIFYDELVHNSILVGGGLSSAKRLAFPHNDVGALDALLSKHRSRFERALIVIEGLYSMDGDLPDLRQFLRLKKRHDAFLMIDEAHALGVLGPRGFGLADECGVDPRDVDIWMGTLSKALAACGGYIAGSGALVDYLRWTVGGFIYSVGMAPPLAAAALQALKLLRAEPGQVARLRANGSMFIELGRSKGLDFGASLGAGVIPLIVGSIPRTFLLGQRLFERGINVLPIIYPAVPKDAARLRFFVTSEHTREQIERAIAVLAEELAAVSHIV